MFPDPVADMSDAPDAAATSDKWTEFTKLAKHAIANKQLGEWDGPILIAIAVKPTNVWIVDQAIGIETIIINIYQTIIIDAITATAAASASVECARGE